MPLYEEFALLNDYFTIQQYRYGGTITLDVSYIEDESLNHSCLIPRFFCTKPLPREEVESKLGR